MSYEKVKSSKYVKIGQDYFGYTVSFIKDDEELKTWIKDSSIEKNDIIIEIKSAKRAVVGNQLSLEEIERE